MTQPTKPEVIEWTSIKIFLAVNSGDDIGLPNKFVEHSAYLEVLRRAEEAEAKLRELRLEVDTRWAPTVKNLKEKIAGVLEEARKAQVASLCYVGDDLLNKARGE